MLQLIVIAVTILANLFIAVIVYKNDRRSTTNALLAFLTITLASWTVTNYIALSPGEESFRLFFVRLTMLVTTPFGPLIFLLATSFPNNKLDVKQHKVLYLTMLIMGLVSAGAAMSPYMFTSLTNLPNNSFSLTPGPAIISFAFNFFIFLGWGFIRLIRKLKSSTGLLKKQLRFFLAGIIISFTLMSATNFIAVVIFSSISLTYLGPPFTLIMVGAIAYAIVKHKFLDIRLVIIRSVSYILTLLSLAVIYIASLFAIQNYILLTQLSSINTAIYALLTLFITLTFQPLKRIFQSATESIFYRLDYNPQVLMSDLSEVCSKTLNLDELSKNFTSTLKKQMKIDGIALLLLNKNKAYFLQNQNLTNLDEKKLSHCFSEEGILRKQFDAQSEKIIVFDELEESEVKEKLKQFNLSIVSPLIVEEQYLGGIFIKQKLSGEDFSREDIRVLEIITPQLAVAINNSLSYEEIKNFSNTLQEKITIATSDLKKANEKLQKIDELKDEFVSVASHELRTPMTAIKNYLWLAINESPKSLTKNTKEYLEITYSSTERLIQLVNEMLIISRIEGGRFKLNKADFEWNQMMEQIYKELKPIAEEKQINLTLKKTDNPIDINADRDRLCQIINNLLGNALKFTPNKGEISITISKENNLIRTDIKDTGPGIALKDQARLFSKFNRLEHSYAKVKEAGTGLGLYISQQIANLHKGKIEVTSKLDKGSTFTLILPIKSS